MSTGRGGAPAGGVSRLGAHAVAAVPVAWLAVLFVVPVLLAVVLSFGHSSFGSVTPGLTLDNYRDALAPLYLQTFARTVGLAVLGSGLCLLAGYPIAYVIARNAGRRSRLLLALVAVPYLTSLLIRVMAWQILLARGGPLDRLLRPLGAAPLDVLDTPVAVLIGIVYVYLPITVLALAVVIERIPADLLDAARDLGAGTWSAFRTITLPLSRPGIATAALLTAVPMLGELVVPQLLGGARGLLAGQAIATQYGQSQDYALGSAMVVLLLVAVGALVAVLLRVGRGFDTTGARS